MVARSAPAPNLIKSALFPARRHRNGFFRNETAFSLKFQQREGEDLTVAEASQRVSELIDTIVDTMSYIDASPALDEGWITQADAQLDQLYRVLVGSMGLRNWPPLLETLPPEEE